MVTVSRGKRYAARHDGLEELHKRCHHLGFRAAQSCGTVPLTATVESHPRIASAIQRHLCTHPQRNAATGMFPMARREGLDESRIIPANLIPRQHHKVGIRLLDCSIDEFQCIRAHIRAILHVGELKHTKRAIVTKPQPVQRHACEVFIMRHCRHPLSPSWHPAPSAIRCVRPSRVRDGWKHVPCDLCRCCCRERAAM